MSTVWKTAIKKFLNDGNEKELRTVLRKEWIDIYPEEKAEIYNFLYHGNQHKLFVYLFAVDLQSQIMDLPWTKALSIIIHHRVKVSKDFIKELSDNLRKQKLTGKTVKSLSDMVSEVRAKERYAFVQKIMRLKQELIASARIAKAENLLDQHMQYMEELRRIAPSEYNVTSIITDREKQRAEKIISKLRTRPRKRSKDGQQLAAEEKSLIGKIAEQAEKFLGKKKVKATDFAFLFRSMGGHQQAIDFIHKNEDLEKKDWQLLDYLFSGKQYLSLLDHCYSLKKKYAQYPDSLFSISYAEAVAYWELGEKEKAINLMGQISSMRPNFKSATETLAQWKEERLE